MKRNRATLNISLETKAQLESLKSTGQSFDGVIRELVKFWKRKGASTGQGDKGQVGD